MIIRLKPRPAIAGISLLFACAALGSQAGQEQTKAPPQPLTDWSLFPQAYSILLNEKLIFPADLSLWRMKIDTSRQLFVDNHMIARVLNIERELHQVRKHLSNPVFTDLNRVYLFKVPAGGFRLWSNAWSGKFGGRAAPPNPKTDEVRICTARSEDGIHWTPMDQSVLSRKSAGAPWEEMTGEIRSIVHRPDDKDPQLAWKMLVLEKTRSARSLAGPFASPREGWDALYLLQLYASADGLRWTLQGDTGLMDGDHTYRSLGFPGNSPPQGIGDTSSMRWDPVLKKYIAHVKYSVGPDWRFPFARVRDKGRLDAFYEARAFAWSESDDMIHWTPPRLFAYPDNEDTKIQGMYGVYDTTGFPYESMWIGCFSMTANVPGDCGAEPRLPVGYKKNWIRLAASRDGRTWYYVGNRAEFIPNGPNDKWDAHYLRMGEVIPGGPLIGEKELWFYYKADYGGIPGCPGLTLPKERWTSALGIGILRRDGFASLNAGEKPGTVVTRPLIFEGAGKLFVNADIRPNGYLKAAVLDEDGAALPAFGEADCLAASGDQVRAPVAWQKQPTLAGVKGRYVRLAFALKNAKLYSFWIE